MSKPPPAPIPARLHVLLAQDAPSGVVIRRGPSKRVCTVGWNREDDTFTLGQWLKGRIYERRSDLSPDGRHMIYFALNGRWNSEAKGSWTALSRAPYLRAIGFWPEGDTFGGGGLFVDNRKYWVNGGGYNKLPTAQVGLTNVKLHPTYVHSADPDLDAYHFRLRRDGWEYKDKQQIKLRHTVATFEKRINNHWLLRKLAHSASTIDTPVGKGADYDEHELENLQTGEKLNGANWEWAEVDRKRLVWAAAGKLFAGYLDAQGMAHTQELYDFNGMEFEPLKAPY